MAETVAQLLVTLGADVTELKKGLQQAQSELQAIRKTTDEAGKGFTRFQATVVTLNQALEIGKAAYQAFASAASSVLSSIESAVSAASDQEDAQLQLKNALELTIGASREVIDAYDAQASALQNVTRFSDEAITAVQALLTRFGVLPEQMAGATQAVADFAAATGQDVMTAAESLARAIEGQSRGLRAYGIVLDDTGSKSQNLANAVDALSRRFGGAAQASVDNLRGSLVVLGNVLSEVEETFGGFFTESQALEDALALVRDALGDINEFLKANKDEIQAFVDAGLTLMIDSTLLAAEAFVKLGRAAVEAGRVTGAIGPETARAFEGALKGVDAGIDILQTKLENIRTQRAFDDLVEQSEEAGTAIGTLPPKIEKVGASYAVIPGAIAPATRATADLTTATDAATDANKRFADGIDETAGAAEAQREVLASIKDDIDLIRRDIESSDNLGELSIEARIVANQVEADLGEIRARIAREPDPEKRLRLQLAEEELSQALEQATSLPLDKAIAKAEQLDQAIASVGDEPIPLAIDLAADELNAFRERLVQAVEDAPTPHKKIEALADLTKFDAAMKGLQSKALAIKIGVEADTTKARAEISAFQRDALRASGVELPIRAESAFARDELAKLRGEIREGETIPIDADTTALRASLDEVFDSLESNIANAFSGLNAENFNTVRTVELDFPDERAVASTVQMAIQMAELTGNTSELEEALRTALLAQERLKTAVQGTDVGFGSFLPFLTRGFNSVTASVAAATAALRRFSDAGNALEPIEIPFQGSGSPTKPLTDYVAYARKLIASTTEGLVPDPVIFQMERNFAEASRPLVTSPSALVSTAATSGRRDPQMEEQNALLAEQIAEQRATRRALEGDRFAGIQLQRADTLVRRQYGRRTGVIPR